MGRKGEDRERWTGRGPASAGAGGVRPGDGTGWLEPGLGRGHERHDPFTHRRPLGPKGYHRPDERVRDEVCERIARSGLDAREVEVAVKAGEVRLSGTVASREDKRALEDLADDVFGVEDVHNRLRIRRSGREGGMDLTGSLLTAGSGTTGTGAAMSAQPRPRRRAPRRGRGRDPGRSH